MNEPQLWEIWWVRWLHLDANPTQPFKDRYALCINPQSQHLAPDGWVFAKITTRITGAQNTLMLPRLLSGLPEDSILCLRIVQIVRREHLHRFVRALDGPLRDQVRDGYRRTFGDAGLLRLES